jgi:CelD/BcsL family acetyltransferase involved in cellulose biosynthesis
VSFGDRMLQNALPLESDLPAERSALPARAILGLDRAEIAWRALEERFVVSPYQRFDWVKAYARSHAAADSDIVLVPIESRGATVAAMPLLIARRLGLTVAQMPSSEIGNTDLLMIDPARAGEVTVEAVRRALIAASPEIGRLDLVLLRNQPARWQGVANPLLAFPHQEAPDSFYLSESRPGTERLSSKRLRNLQRGRRRLEELLGPVVLRRATTTAEIERYHAAFLEQRGERFRQQGIRNIFAEDRFRSFFREGVTASLDSERPALALHALTAGDTIVAKPVSAPMPVRIIPNISTRSAMARRRASA